MRAENFLLLLALLLTACASTPTAKDWQQLESTLTAKLEIPQPPKSTRDPFALEDQSGATQSQGWLGAWSAALSTHAVVAESAADIAAAVNFARQHRLRLVVKGTGHDYLGRSNAPDSLLVWTHRMRKITVHDSFVPHGCSNTHGIPAVTLEAGTRWIEAYQAVTVKAGRYVQGGGCTSVGAAGGFLQGGGFGSWSKRYGTAAANLLEAEIVTADGQLRTANACQNTDLFWALRGGGGATFGIVTRVVYRTHPLPRYFGWVNGKITATNDDAFQELLERFLHFYREKLSNEHWGEQVKIRGGNSIELALAFEDLTANEAEKIWQPFREWIDAHPDRFTMEARYSAIPGRKMWDRDYILRKAPNDIKTSGDLFWWSGGDAEQVGISWYAYQSRWIPLELFEASKARAFAATLFRASRHWSLGLHFNKGQAGASPAAVALGRETAMNPALYRAAALLIMGAGEITPNQDEGETQKAQVSAAMQIIREATPEAGTYVNETDYFEPDWQKAFWGENYPRLLEIKRRYDPEGLFVCHHCVGS
jgi:FAD/FMN-containing dehydrogenase